MADVDDILQQYLKSGVNGLRGQPITKENYNEVINYLKEAERTSHGIIKKADIIKFLEEWFQ